MTNAEKFEEVFGFSPDTNSCVHLINCEDCKHHEGNYCTYDYWDDEYKEKADVTNTEK